MRSFSFIVSSTGKLESKLKAITFNDGCCYLVQLFSTESASQVLSYSQGIRKLLPDNTSILGQSTATIINDGELYSEGTLVSVIEFTRALIRTSSVTYTDNPVDDGYSLIDGLALSSKAMP